MSPTALSASTLTGDKVRNQEGDKLGHLEEIVIDIQTGRIAYAVLASGGFLGVGDKYFAVPWDMLSVDTDSHEIVVDVDKEVLEKAPGFDKDNWPDVEDRAFMVDVYRYYGSEPYWETDEAAVDIERDIEDDDFELDEEEYEEDEYRDELPERVD